MTSPERQHPVRQLPYYHLSTSRLPHAPVFHMQRITRTPPLHGGEHHKSTRTLPCARTSQEHAAGARGRTGRQGACDPECPPSRQGWTVGHRCWGDPRARCSHLCSEGCNTQGRGREQDRAETKATHKHVGTETEAETKTEVSQQEGPSWLGQHILCLGRFENMRAALQEGSRYQRTGYSSVSTNRARWGVEKRSTGPRAQVHGEEQSKPSHA
jgi:hypothetical protein